MKNFIITLPNKDKDPKGSLKNFLAEQIITKYPYLSVAGIDKPNNNPGIQFAGPGDAFTFGASRTHDVSWIAKPFVRAVPKAKTYDLYDNFFEAMQAIDSYASRNEDKDILDGYIFNKPYRIYDSFIQIGNEIIPKYNRNYYNSLPSAQKNVLNLVIVNITNIMYA